MLEPALNQLSDNLLSYRVRHGKFLNVSLVQHVALGGLKYLSLCGVQQNIITGAVVQSVARLIADPGVVGLIQAQSHTFVEIDYGTVSLVILLPPLIQEGLMSVTSECMCTNR